MKLLFTNVFTCVLLFLNFSISSQEINPELIIGSWKAVEVSGKSGKLILSDLDNPNREREYYLVFSQDSQYSHDIVPIYRKHNFPKNPETATLVGKWRISKKGKHVEFNDMDNKPAGTTYSFNASMLRKKRIKIASKIIHLNGSELVLQDQYKRRVRYQRALD